MERELENNATYREASEDQTQKINNGIKRLIDSMYKNNEINKDIKNYLKPIDSRGGKAKGNPKIHKRYNPIRTIVNGRNHPTEKIAEFVENELRDHVKTLPGYLYTRYYGFYQKTAKVRRQNSTRLHNFLHRCKGIVSKCSTRGGARGSKISTQHACRAKDFYRFRT